MQTYITKTKQNKTKSNTGVRNIRGKRGRRGEGVKGKMGGKYVNESKLLISFFPILQLTTDFSF